MPGTPRLMISPLFRNRWEVFISWELCTGMSNKHNFLTNTDGLMIVDSECVRRRDDER
jgi:hypothetical protein